MDGAVWVDRELMVEPIRALLVAAMVEAAVLALVPDIVSLSRWLSLGRFRFLSRSTRSIFSGKLDVREEGL